MSHPLTALLESVEVLEPRQEGRLQVFGLRWAGRPGPDYKLLDDALADGTAEVQEISEGGSVPTLKLVNKGDTLVFILAGEHLAGAKQNRVLNADVLAPARHDLPIPVSCVEAHRWHYHTQSFGSTHTMSHSGLRRAMHKQTSDSYRARGTPTSDQGAVWREVDRKLASMGSRSPSAALHKAYEDHAEHLAALEARLPAPEGCAGAAFALDGKLIGADLFDRPETLARLWSKLVRASGLDALEAAPPPETSPAAATAEDVRAWLRAGSQARAEAFPSPGVGQDVRLESAALMGSGLVLEEHAFHVSIFPPEPAPASAT